MTNHPLSPAAYQMMNDQWLAGLTADDIIKDLERSGKLSPQYLYRAKIAIREYYLELDCALIVAQTDSTGVLGLLGLR